MTAVMKPGALTTGGINSPKDMIHNENWLSINEYIRQPLPLSARVKFGAFFSSINGATGISSPWLPHGLEMPPLNKAAAPITGL